MWRARPAAPTGTCRAGFARACFYKSFRLHLHNELAAMAISSASRMPATKGSKNAKKASTSSIGAPSQRSQGSRKGKRAWRKNVDLDDVEGALEDARDEERVTGCVDVL
jgi:hypothetical protein